MFFRGIFKRLKIVCFYQKIKNIFVGVCHWHVLTLNKIYTKITFIKN